MFPAVSPVSLIACSIGTPDETAPEKVRDQRANATFCTTSPIFAGSFSVKRSQARWPASVFFHLKKRKTATTNPGMIKNQ